MSGAHIDGDYRYALWRVWDEAHPLMMWVMLNPSTADATEDDPTIRRCMGFARRENCGGIMVVNLFAYRATDPDDLASAKVHRVGPDNDKMIRRHAREVEIDGGPVVYGWGAHPLAEPRAPAVHAILEGLGPLCLGTTKSGAPKHPLYIKADTPLVPFTL